MKSKEEEEYEKRVKDAYYGGRKNWRLKDKFDIKEFIVIKENLGLWQLYF